MLKKRGLNNLICSTLESVSFKPNSIFSAGAFDVIEHIEDDKDFLSKLSKNIAKGGYIFITVPALKILWSDEDNFAGHFRRYNLKMLVKVLNESGFEIEYKTYLFSPLVLPIFILRSIPSWLKLRKGGQEENFQKEHNLNVGIKDKVIAKILNWEIGRVERLKKIYIGSSCLIVARKI